MPKRVPKIRFKKYTDEWKEDILSEFLEVSKEKNFLGKYDKTDVLSVSGDCGIVNQIEHKGRSFAGASVANYGVVDTGDVVYTKSPLLNTPYGIIKTNKGKPGIVSTLYAVYKPKENVDPNFIECYFEQNARINNYLKPLVNKGAKNDMKVTDANALNGSVIFPKKDEQLNISKCMNNIDEMINKISDKRNKLEDIKNALLRKMFPNDGKKVPQIRFKGYQNLWEKCLLEDYIIEYHEVTTENNQYPILTSSRKGIFLQTDYYSGNQVASSDNTGYNVVPYGYFTYRHMSDDEIFHFNINDIVENGIVSTLYPVFTINEKMDSRYLQYQLNYGQEFAKYAILQKQGGSRTYMYMSKIKKLSLTIPKSIKEQRKISGYFMKLDQLSSLYLRKLNMLKNIKKSFLEQMFVN